MIIVKGTVVTAEKAALADVRIEEGRVVEVGNGLAPRQAGEEVIDAAGLLVMPGAVDVHTHMDLLVGTARASDSFLTGTVAAACGGTTSIIDHMAFGPAGCNLQHQVDAYHVLADGKAVIDYGFHGVVDRVDEGILDEMEHIAAEGITSFKFYMTYDRRLDDESILRLLARARELGVLLCVHCENHATLTWLRALYVAQGRTDARYHAKSRPASCEAEAIFRVLTLAKAAGEAPVYVVHTSSAAGLAAVAAFDANTPPAFAHLETCPQYLLLDESSYGLPDGEGLKFVMSPPVRRAEDREALWAALADGRVEVVGTDHCPFYFSEKKRLGEADFTACPNGAPGVELRLALMHSEGVVRRGMSLSRLVDVCATTPARRFGVYPQKGTIAPGSDADIVLFDPARRVRVTHGLLHERVDYTPYEGMELVGYPVMTISRGDVIVREGAFVGADGRGRYLRRSLPDLR
ncbi:MAG: dihydropyrimidinase [Coriobacteriales bacterium]|jgi:dihydropyrimidinase|nr:dihydropyrimidinase [Coriobacteriales bacterium]